MTYLLDTKVVSALRVRGQNLPVQAWASAVPIGDQYVTATTIAEIERGVIGKERSDAQQGVILRRWFDDHVLPAFDRQGLPFDLAAARILSAYRVPEHAPYDDALIAAIAQSAEMTVATRNTKHFEPPVCLASTRGTPPRPCPDPHAERTAPPGDSRPAKCTPFAA